MVQLGGITDTDGTVNLAVGDTVITVEVTAEDGTTKTYTVTVTRASLSADATLSSLDLSGVTLSPLFASDTTSYTGSVASSVTSTMVAAATTHAGAMAVVKLRGADTDGTVNLAVGDTVITVEVTAEDGTTETYIVTVTRMAAPPPPTPMPTPVPTPTPAPTPSGSTDTDRSSNTPPRFVEGVETAREVSENAEAGTPIGRSAQGRRPRRRQAYLLAHGRERLALYYRQGDRATAN